MYYKKKLFLSLIHTTTLNYYKLPIYTIIRSRLVKKESSICKIQGSHSCVDEDSSLPGCESASLTLKLMPFKHHQKMHIQPNTASHPRRFTPLMFPHSSVHFFSTAPINNIIQNITCASEVGQLVKVYCGQHFILNNHRNIKIS